MIMWRKLKTYVHKNNLHICSEGKTGKNRANEKDGNLGPGRLCWSWNCIMFQIFVLMISSIMLS